MVMNGGYDDSLPRAFREATEEDTIQVLNAMSNPAAAATLYFYMIPCSWMKTCKPYLLGNAQARPEEPIVNNALLLRGISNNNFSQQQQPQQQQQPRRKQPQGAVSDDDDEEVVVVSKEESESKSENSFPRYSSHQTNNSSTTALATTSTPSRELRPGLVYERDYFLLGFNAWTLIKNKFGYDTELWYRCVRRQNNTLAAFVGQNLVAIPDTGRFEFVVRETIPGADNVISEDDDDEDDDLYPGSGLSNPAGSEVDNSRAIVLHPSSRGDENGSSYYSNHNKKSIHRRDDYSTEAVMEVDNSSEERKHAALKRKRYGSGLGNLGNTCFMNSTLQCLAHTQPLRQYFVSGEYENDLNRDNPLGTGGELATQFADLLSEMWGVSFRSTATTSSYGVVYPRNFKQTLGRHAEQFLGYDQHDSQELATYLLDALHEDTNRVTKKPYIEKPEQGEDESDDVAADKAWSLHLRREDSRVLENFMGQVKSRVQCPIEGCGRVSTTFDPFMYLSVPIPGATDRTIKIIFCPLEGSKHLMNIRLSKTASMSTLQGKVVDMWEKISGKKIATENLLLVDVWHHAFYSIYLPDEDVEKIREVDTTYAYELQPAAEFELPDDEYENEKIAEERLKRSKRKSCKRFLLPVAELTRLNTEDEWSSTLQKYSKQTARVLTLLNRKRGTIDARIEFYNKLESFLDECYRADEHSEEEESDDLESGQDTREKSTFFPESGQETHEVARFRKSFSEVTEESKLFNVRTAFDVAALEFASKKFRQFTLELMREDRLKYKEGLTVQVALQMSSMVGYSRSDRPFASPLCLRLSPRTTVYQLREVLAACLPIKSAAEEDDALQDPTSGNDETVTSRLDAMQVVRQIPLTYEPKKYSAYRPAFVNQMGMLNKGTNSDEDGPVSFASPDDENEKISIAELIGQHGKISMHWPNHLCQLYFDEELHEKMVETNPIKKNSQAAKAIKVKDCIEKYCQMEQLEESEMWYCDRCKKHVRAWKQFHLYRTPPILIVHLKRFHYSAMSHRRDKIDAFIDFPLEGLDLTDDVMQYAEDCKPIYECYAVSNHYGRLGGGHYTAYAMNDDGVWCHFDDSRVTTDIDPKDVVSNAAYVLYYRRRDLALSQTPSKLPMPAIVGDFVQSDSMMEIDDDNNNNTNNKKVIVEDDTSSEEDVTPSNIGDNSDMTDVDKAFMEGPESFEKSFPSQ